MSNERTHPARSFRRTLLKLEHLENRLAPATLVNSGLVTYQDTDGDSVSVQASQPLFNASTVNQVFTFDQGSVNGDNSLKQQLQEFNLAPLGNTAAGASVSFQVTVIVGNGLVNVGFINAPGIDLGTMTVAGDLGRIIAGSGSATIAALASLTTNTIGAQGTSTQGSGGNLTTTINGTLTALTVHSDIVTAVINVSAQIGSIGIGGSLVGGAADTSGGIDAAGAIGPVNITANIQGGMGNGTALIQSGTQIGTVTIGGSVLGGGGIESGEIKSNAIGDVSIGGNLSNGIGMDSGRVRSFGNIGNVTISTSILGGTVAADGSLGTVAVTHDVNGGTILSNNSNIAGVTIGGTFDGSTMFAQGNIGPVKIVGNVVGEAASGTGLINCNGMITSVEVDGSVQGGGGQESGEIKSNAIGDVTIGGGLSNGTGPLTGRIRSFGNIGNVTINGAVVGGTVAADGSLGTVAVKLDVNGGTILSNNSTIAGVTIGGTFDGSTMFAQGNIGPVKIVGNVVGEAANGTGLINCNGMITSVEVDGSVQGGGGQESGEIKSNAIGDVTIGGGLSNGTGPLTGRIRSFGNIGNVTINGAVVGGTVAADGSLGTVAVKLDVNGGTILSNTSTIAGITIGGKYDGSTTFAQAGIGPIKIVGNVVGNGVANSGQIASNGTMAQVEVDGSVLGGAGQGSGEIECANLGTITIGGNLKGGTGQFSGAVISMGTMTSVNIGGSVVSGSIRAHYSITTILVHGSLIGTAAAPAVISAQGQQTITGKTDIAIQRLQVNRNVTFANILAGYDTNLNPTDGSAQIATVIVGINWTASNLVAGATAGADGLFGTADDAPISAHTTGILSTINTISIGGTVSGTAGNPNDHFGFVAQWIRKMTVGGVAVVLKPGPFNDIVNLGTTGDVTLREVGRQPLASLRLSGIGSAFQAKKDIGENPAEFLEFVDFHDPAQSLSRELDILDWQL